jgi:hypothetical protein
MALFFATILMLLGQTILWFQSNAQFFNIWAKNHPLTLSVVLGVPASYLFIKATELCAIWFDGATWPGRLLGFGLGSIMFAILSYSILHESITLKTVISLVLAVMIVLVQILWK